MRKRGKKRIQLLINQMFGEAETDEEAFLRNTDLKEDLKVIGPAIVDPILDSLFLKKQENRISFYQRNFGSPLIHLIEAIEGFAESKHAQRLAEMLRWEEIAFDVDGANRCTLLDILKRIGDETTIPTLKKFVYTARKTKNRYPDLYYIYPEKHVQETIRACRERSREREAVLKS